MRVGIAFIRVAWIEGVQADAVLTEEAKHAVCPRFPSIENQTAPLIAILDTSQDLRDQALKQIDHDNLFLEHALL
jgi:hypothetical protein